MPTCRAIFALPVLLGLPLAAQQPPPPAQPDPAPAQTAPEERLKALEARVRALEADAAARDQAPGPPARLGGADGAASKALNPDISLIGNVVASAGHDPVRPSSGLDLHEAEVAFGAVVDPYSRGDVILSFGEEGAAVEEAYLTFNALPGGFVAKAGKLRAAFGKVNPAHTHTLPWTDRPLVAENLAGGEEGIADAGLSVSRILPAPGSLFLEATGQVFRGTSGDLFEAHRKKDVTVVGHLKAYQDLTENTNLEVGLSYARGHNPLGEGLTTTLRGLDATLRWKPLMRSIYTSLLWRTELVWSRREEAEGVRGAKGFYSSLDYRLNRRWTLGARVDRSERAEAPDLVDRGQSLLGTYWISEFSQLRGQLKSTRYGGGQKASEFRLQLVFLLGAHGAHPF
jgi:hypothetical protein